MATWQEFTEALPFLRNAFLVGGAIGSLAPLIGAYFLLRRIVLLGVTIPQVSSAGIAFALLLQGFGWWSFGAGHEHGAPLAGALLFTVGGIVFLGMLTHRRPELADLSIGFVFAVSSAASLLLLSQSPIAEAHMLDLLKGEIIATSDHDLVRTLFFYFLVLSALLFFHKEFLLISYDRDFAVTMRKAVARYDLLFYVVAGCAVSLCVMVAGPITTFGHLILAPAIALLFARGMTRLFVYASVIGGVSSVIGLAGGFFLNLPAGPATVAVLALSYGLLWAGKQVWAALRR